MRKKISVCIISICMIFCLFGCNKNNDDTTTTTEQNITTECSSLGCED